MGDFNFCWAESLITFAQQKTKLNLKSPVVVVLSPRHHGLIVLKMQGLRYNFQGGKTAQPSVPPVHFWAPFISRAHVSIVVSQIVNYWLNVLSMISFFFNFIQLRKSIQHCEFMIVKMWNLNDSVTMELLQRRLLACWVLEHKFRLWNPIILQPERFRLKFRAPNSIPVRSSLL